MARTENKGWHQQEPPENIAACLTCKRPRCSGNRECMLQRKRDVLEGRDEDGYKSVLGENHETR